MNYEEAVEHYKDTPRASLDEFIEHGKNGFIFLELVAGNGWILQAIEFAEQLKKTSEMTDKESAIYATGYWNGIQKAKEKNETLDTRSYLIGRYDGHPSKNNEAYEKGFIDGMQKQMQSRVQQMVEGYAQFRELTDEEIDNIFGISALNTTVTLTTEQCYWIVDAILRKASEK